MPMLCEGDSNMIILPSAYSLATIERRFERLNSVQFAGIEADLLWDSERLMACAVSKNVIDTDRRQVVASIEMQKAGHLFGKETLSLSRYWEQDPCQIQGVVVLSNYQEYGLATLMYETLVLELGMVIVSDNEQYAGGKALWKHIAQRSERLKVYIFDSEAKTFFPYKDEERICYDGANVNDEDIWSLEPDQAKYAVVLIAEPS